MKKFDEIIEFAEIREFINMPLKNFSSGMKVRLAFAIAINVEADIYLVDEVLAVGDAIFQKKCFKVFRDLKKQKKTVVLVTHDMNNVRDFASKAALIFDHKILAKGEPEQVIGRYDLLNYEIE